MPDNFESTTKTAAPTAKNECDLSNDINLAYRLINEQIGDGSYREFPALGDKLLEETIKKCRERACPIIEECKIENNR